MAVRTILYKTATQHWQRHRLVFSTSPISFASHHKPGGTFILTTGNVTSRVIKQDRDKWGRWVVQELQGSDGTILAIFSVYQPVAKGGVPGKTTVAAQQQSLLLLSKDSTSDPRTAFRRDLLQAIKQYTTHDHNVLVLGDFNEQMGSDSAGISNVAGQCGLLDVMACRHHMPPPATYARGTKCLDYALASPHVCKALKRAGYEAFNARVHSDHRGYYFDFDSTALFGTATQDLATRHKRGLVTSSIHHVTTYIRKKYELLIQHNTFQRAASLQHPGNRHSHAERIDLDVAAASLAAEAALPKYDEPAWSVELAKARNRVILLSKWLSALRTKLDPQVFLENIPASELEAAPLPTTALECTTQLREAKTLVARIVSESFEKRDAERKRRIQFLDLSHDKEDKARAQLLRRLQKAEASKELSKKIRHLRQKGSRRGVTRIEIPKNADDDLQTCTEWVQIDVPSEIVDRLQTRNRRHFGQAHGTPFTVSPLNDHLGYCADGPGVASLLEGTFDYSSYDDNVQLLLQHLKRVEDTINLPVRPTISEQEFVSKLKIWSESTTTSPSGLHLGHYKALISRHSFSSDAPDEDLTPEYRDQRDELNFKQGELLSLHLRMLNYALERGYSYHRWQSIANTVLFKDSTNVRLDRTRMIHIYEADFNLALGIKWRTAMHYAEDNSLLNDGQHGSRARRNATDPVFIEELQCEISRATRKQLILTNYDATACYDRIPPNLGMTVSQKFGVPAAVTQANALTLRDAAFRVRTELGLAAQSYSHSSESPIYGTGQGSANSPAIWCFLSSILFDCYDTKATQAQYWDSDGNNEVILGMIGFVDDCNGQTNKMDLDGSPQNLQELIARSQLDAQAWTDILSVSGGALSLSKCLYQIMQWIFSRQGAPVLVPSFPKDQVQIKVWDEYAKTTQVLPNLSVYQAHKTLGHYKDPAGNQTEQFKQLQLKSQEITSFLWTVPLSRHETWTFYYACYLPAISYPLPCSSLTSRQLESIQKQAMKILVARCGFNRNIKKEVLYGPMELGGASFRHLAVQQGVGQTTLFLRHWRRPLSTAGKLLRVTLSWFQQQVGVSFPILEDVHTSLPHLESKWVASLRSFLSSINASVQVDHTTIKPLQRAHDFYLMDVIMSSNKFTQAEIRRLNYCRLYLRVLTASDLTDTTGIRLDTSKLHGHPSIMSSAPTSDTIYQGRPGDAEWALWKKANRIWSHHDNTLIQPLGMWILDCHQLSHHYQGYMSEGDILWIRQNDHYIKCLETPDSYKERTRYEETPFQLTWHDLPVDAIPAEVRYHGNKFWTKRGRVVAIDQFRPARPSTFPTFVATLDAWEIELLEHTCLFSDPGTIGVALGHGIRAVSDGSDWDHTQGTFGWSMSDDAGTRVAMGRGHVRSPTPYSYRAECYGMLSILCFLKRLAEFTGQWEPWNGTLATDSMSLIDTLSGKKTSPGTIGVEEVRYYSAQSHRSVVLDPLIPEWDIIFGIQTLFREMPGLGLQHIRGHQDKKVVYHRLPLLAQLNVDADTFAGEFQRDHGKFLPQVLLTKWAGCLLQTPEGTTTAHYDSALRHRATYKPLWKALKEKNKWSDTIMHQINWKAHGASLRHHLPRKSHFIKACHGFLATNRFLHRRDPNPDRRLCPLCKQCDEDRNHIMKCTHSSRGEWREKALQELKQTCEKLGTRPILGALLLTAVKDWLESPPDTRLLIRPHSYSSELTQLICQQNLIGWDQVFLGRFSNIWASIQDNHYARRQRPNAPKRRTGQTWQAKVGACLLEQWYVVWKLRNQDVHGSDPATRDAAARQEVDRRLCALYALKHTMEPSVQALLYEDIEEHYAHTLLQNQNWLAIHEPLGVASVRQAKKKAIQGVPSMRRFLPGIT